MKLSPAEKDAIKKMNPGTISMVLREHGWTCQRAPRHNVDQFIKGDFEVICPTSRGDFPDEDRRFAEIAVAFAEEQGLSSFEAIGRLSGGTFPWSKPSLELAIDKQTTTLTWHDPGDIPPVGVPLIVDIDGQQRAAEFTGDRLKFCNGMHVLMRRDGTWDQNYEINAIAWGVPS